jgi:hypothetical protein
MNYSARQTADNTSGSTLSPARELLLAHCRILSATRRTGGSRTRLLMHQIATIRSTDHKTFTPTRDVESLNTSHASSLELSSLVSS